jgi:flagellar hook-basal body complex protein FliE
MDALSALKMMAGPQMGTQLDKVVQDASAKAIPANELSQLGSINPDLAPQTINPAGDSQAIDPSSFATGGSFSNLLGDFVNGVNAKQNEASDAISGLMSGKNVSLHQAMISMEEASVSFSMMVEVRNKLLDSYQELMRMQI